jgi:hypothetical protein
VFYFMRRPWFYLLSQVFLFALTLSAQIPGVNVNMVSGTTWPDGDPFLQRQNEPSLAVSTRNALHLLAGANDYRTVDLPGLPNGETGDAWLGVFKSYDGGLTWKSNLHPGCPQSVPQCDGAPTLKGYAAAADPVVRTGNNGMFYYSGIAFTRTSPQKSVLFVSRFIDNNNEESGDPIKYINTVTVAAGSPTVFIDKPWMAVDIPRQGAATCTIAAPQVSGGPVSQQIPAGNIYVAYTTFTTDGQPPAQIQFVRSTDCGATWSAPIPLSDNVLNQGAMLAIDPASGTLYVAWRRFATKTQTDAIMIVKSTDGGKNFTPAIQVATINPFDQGTTAFSFRSNAYPAMAVDGAGRIYLAWAERGLGAPVTSGDARIVLTTSRDAFSWTQRKPVDDYQGRGHQYMPAMTFGGGKLLMVFYDLRDDATTGAFTPLGQGKYQETRVAAGDLATVPPHPEKVFTQFILDAAPADLNEGGLLRRHTVDVRAVQAEPADLPVFNSVRVSQYEFGSLPGSTLVQQLQVNPPNFPLFSQGTVPFVGDYLDVAASPAMVPGSQPGTWKFNTDPSPSIVFHAVWADNRDVRPPANGDWTDYTPPVSAATAGLSVYDPTKSQPSCIAGQTGMRNENIYTARITQGLTVTSPSNSKTLGKIQRSFPVVVANSTNVTKSFRLTIQNQPPGGKASFLQFPDATLPDPLTMLDVQVSPISSTSRMVFVTSTQAQAPVVVEVAEISSPGAPNLRLGGLRGTVTLNPDPLNPANPAIANNEIFNPAIANPAIANPAIANPAIANPAIANPAIANPAIANPAIANLSTSNADIANPAIANPAIANPAIANPAIANTAITDANWALTNNGNSQGTYSIHFITKNPIPSRVLAQLIINKIYKTPVATGCSLVEQPQTQVITNVSNPPLVPQQSFQVSGLGRTISAALRRQRRRQRGILQPRDSGGADTDITDPSVGDTTVTIGPNETVYVTLRFFNTDATQPLGFDPGNDITTVSISHAADTGSTQPPVASSHLLAATIGLQPAVVGGKYDDFLIATGGQGPYTWTLLSGNLPPGLSLSPGGEITGTVTGASGTYTFTVQVSDSSGAPPVQETVSIVVSGVALTFSGVQAAGPGGSASALPGQTITVTATVTNSGSQADGVTPSIAVISVGSAAASCGSPQPPSANIASGGQQTFTFTCGPVSGSGILSFPISLTATDDVVGATLSISPATSNSVSILGTPPVVTVAATTGGQPYSPGAWTNQSVTVVFTCTPSFGGATQRQVTVSSEGANQTVGTTCTDLAGNSTSASFSGINIDLTPPIITVQATSGGQPYAPGTVANQPVIVTFLCSDGLSGVDSVTPVQTISPPATGQSVTGTCTDRAGNSSSITFGNINAVSAPPVMSVSYSNGYAAGTWSSQAVTATFVCTPANGLSVRSLSSPVTFSTQGANQTSIGKCTDSAGNSTQITAGPVNIETSPPQLTLQPLPQATNGWYNAPVTISWTCTDVVAATSKTLTRTISTEGANQVASISCSNLAGTTVTASQTVSLDLTPPVVTATATVSGAPYRSGTPTNQPVTVTFTCTDALSGVATAPQTQTVNPPAVNQSITGTCTDKAGNTGTATVVGITTINTNPTMSVSYSNGYTAGAWTSQPVTVTFACTPASGLTVQSLAQPVTLSAEGANQSPVGKCTDSAGNSTQITAGPVNIETSPPQLTLQSLPQASAFGWYNSAVTITWMCTDVVAGTHTPISRTVSTEGANQTVSVTCSNMVGVTVSGSQTVSIDLTPPVVTASATANGAPYTSGTVAHTPVTVTFTCTDALSGVASAPLPQVVNPPAVNQSATGTCTDKAGNSASATFSGITTSSVPPTLTASYSNSYTPGAWSAQAVTVTFTCTPVSGLTVQSVTAPVTLATDGANQSVTGSCTDSAGGAAQISAGPINIETTPPQLTLQSISPTASNGWYNATVTITWTCTDVLLSTHTPIVRTVSSEGANQTVSVTCSNVAGTKVTGSQTVSIDLTPPTIQGTATPASPASGWYVTPVAVSFTCTDALSGVANGNPTGGTTLTADTNGTTVTGTCKDVAGNTATAPVGPIKIDRTPPTITFQSISPINAAGWSNGPVTVTWSCTDSGSGPVSATVTQQVTGDTSNGSATGTCTDVAGNSASNTKTGIQIDTIPPAMRFLKPADGAVYALGATDVAIYSCSDGGSGIASCVGTAPSGQTLQFTTPGQFSFTVTATDKAGNQLIQTHKYTVNGAN